jgi:hypothetical protein
MEVGANFKSAINQKTKTYQMLKEAGIRRQSKLMEQEGLSQDELSN